MQLATVRWLTRQPVNWPSPGKGTGNILESVSADLVPSTASRLIAPYKGVVFHDPEMENPQV